jgi:hypothetical protein
MPMLGREKSTVEDVFETEDRLCGELEAARRQLAETTTKLAELDGAYKAAASDALTSGNDGAALQLRRDIEKANVKKDGLDLRILDLEPRYQEATKLAQTERLAQIERERRERLATLVEKGKETGEKFLAQCEIFMRSLSDFDDVREQLAAPEHGVDGLHELEVLGNAVFQFGPGNLQGMLLAKGWRQRTTMPGATYLEVIGLQAPKK